MLSQEVGTCPDFLLWFPGIMARMALLSIVLRVKAPRGFATSDGGGDSGEFQRHSSLIAFLSVRSDGSAPFIALLQTPPRAQPQ